MSAPECPCTEARVTHRVWNAVESVDRCEKCAEEMVALGWQSRALVDPPERVSERSDLEEMQVVSLCERFGYGRVMQIAADAWAELDPIGALTVGPCRCYVEEPVERVSEASALREACQRLVDAHGVVTINGGAGWTRHIQPVIYDIMKILRALEDTKGET